MKIIAVNGSARKNWNTHTLLSKALEGAESAGAQTELINLYDLDYKGCTGCLLCKAKGGKSLGHCAVNDGLKPVLERIDKSDGLILGSPVYLGEITAMLRAFWERLVFQYLSYDSLSETYFQGSLKTAFVYTMNATDQNVQDSHELFDRYAGILSHYFDYTGTVLSTATLQMEDYSKFHMALLDEAERKERREKAFPEDCRKAYGLGKAMVNAQVDALRCSKQARLHIDVSPSAANAIDEYSWKCLQAIEELATVVPLDQQDVWIATKLRGIQGDFEDDLVLAAAERSHADYLFSNDAIRLRHCCVAALTPKDMVKLLKI